MSNCKKMSVRRFKRGSGKRELRFEFDFYESAGVFEVISRNIQGSDFRGLSSSLNSWIISI